MELRDQILTPILTHQAPTSHPSPPLPPSIPPPPPNQAETLDRPQRELESAKQRIEELEEEVFDCLNSNKSSKVMGDYCTPSPMPK